MNTGWADRTFVALTALCEESDHEARRWIIAVIFNRARTNPQRYGQTPGAVCMRRYQFSEFNDDSGDNANLERALSLPPNSEDVVDAYAAYDEMVNATDPTGGATHFVADSIAAPSWTIGATYTGRKGSTLFYTNVS